MTKGYVSIRNEDGTSWFVGENSFGDREDRKTVSDVVFAMMQEMVSETKKNDCPDNGFFGWYNLTFHPVK